MRAGLRLLVNGQPDMEVVAEADSAATASPLIGALNPDVVLLDLTLPGGGGLELIEFGVRGRTDSSRSRAYR